MSTQNDKIPLLAYRLGSHDVEITTAPRHRTWMDLTSDHFANRCLPLLLANQSGWHLANPQEIEVTWDGGAKKESLRVTLLGDYESPVAVSHFGSGIVTFHLPYLFRTPTGYNLHVRGPANRPKDAVYALEGIVESDWSVATFTMNWKVTRPDTTVRFSVGEPIALIAPQRRGELERVEPSFASLDDDPELAASYKQWADGRKQFNRALRDPALASSLQTRWQKHYFRGRTLDGEGSDDHQLKLDLKEFMK